MTNSDFQSSPNLIPSQTAWVVKDLEKSKAFFRERFGVKNFSPTGATRLQDFDGTYYGRLCDAENLVTMAYSGGTFLEISQPVSGESIFLDYINENPVGGIHHIAYSTSIANLDSVISEFGSKGFTVISSFDTAIAKLFSSTLVSRSEFSPR